MPSAELLGLREEQQIEVWENCASAVLQILLLGAEKAVGGDAELLTFFSLDLDDAEEDKLIEEAVLSGCGDAYERVLLAVQWGAPKVLLRHLEGAAGQISEHELAQVFQSALQTGRNDVVQTLIDFGELVGCHPRFISFRQFDNLWMVEHDRYELFQHLVVRRDRELKVEQSNALNAQSSSGSRGRRSLAAVGRSTLSGHRLASPRRSRVLHDRERTVAPLRDPAPSPHVVEQRMDKSQKESSRQRRSSDEMVGNSRQHRLTRVLSSFGVHVRRSGPGQTAPKATTIARETLET